MYNILYARDCILFFLFKKKIKYGEKFYVNSIHFSCRGNKRHASFRCRARQRGTDGQKNYTDTSAMGGDQLINDLTKAGNN